MKLLTNLDLNKNETQNFVIQNLQAAPLNPREGQKYYNTTDKKWYGYNGEQWVSEKVSTTNVEYEFGISNGVAYVREV